MSNGSAQGFWMSTALHAAVAAAIFLFGYVLKNKEPEDVKIFELVAGEGDNYAATEAPALGTPGGVKIDIPAAPERKSAPETPVEPAQPPQSNPTATSTPPTPKTKEPPVSDFKKKIVRDLIRAESQAKRDAVRERAAEKKRLDAEKKRAEEEQKKMTKEEFDKANKAKTAASTSKSSSQKVAKIDVEGIKKGVTGGSSANKVAGAGGKALKAEFPDVLAAYDSLLKQKLRREFEPPPGLSDALKVDVQVRSNPDGSFTSARVTKPSGSAEFDAAVLDALRRVQMPPRPDSKSELIEFTFTMRERNEG
jgi:colicin import membrane protein